jgi:hypothetical protein
MIRCVLFLSQPPPSYRSPCGRRKREQSRIERRSVCHGIAQQAADPSKKGAPDLAFSKSVKSEQAMRQKLVNEWSTFLPTEKTNCIGEQMGGMASYTDLVSCLEMAKDAWQLNQGK